MTTETTVFEPPLKPNSLTLVTLSLGNGLKLLKLKEASDCPEILT